MIELLQKNNLKWDSIHKKLLMSLKQPCVKLQYFALANSRKIFILETYVCATGLKAVLNKKKKKTIGIPKQGFMFKTFGVVNL